MAVGIFDTIITTKTHNHHLEVNLYNHVVRRECFVIPLSTSYKPMIEVQMRLYKIDGVIPSCLCYFFEVVYITYTMATRDSPDIYARALGLGHIYQANPS